jgi:deoxycytidylate deaminase
MCVHVQFLYETSKSVHAEINGVVFIKKKMKATKQKQNNLVVSRAVNKSNSIELTGV